MTSGAWAEGAIDWPAVQAEARSWDLPLIEGTIESGSVHDRSAVVSGGDGVMRKSFAVTSVTVEMPDEALRTVSGSAEEFGHALRLAAAMYWYSRGTISQEIAASVAGLNRAVFIDALIDAGLPVIEVDDEMLAHELAAMKRHTDVTGG